MFEHWLALYTNQLEAVAPGGSLCQPLLWEVEVTSSQSTAPEGHARQVQHDAHHGNGERATDVSKKSTAVRVLSRERCQEHDMRRQQRQTTGPQDAMQKWVETANFIVVDFLQRCAPVAAGRPELNA